MWLTCPCFEQGVRVRQGFDISFGRLCHLTCCSSERDPNLATATSTKQQDPESGEGRDGSASSERGKKLEDAGNGVDTNKPARVSFSEKVDTIEGEWN